jgi:hypothetical protein
LLEKRPCSQIIRTHLLETIVLYLGCDGGYIIYTLIKCHRTLYAHTHTCALEKNGERAIAKPGEI